MFCYIVLVSSLVGPCGPPCYPLSYVLLVSFIVSLLFECTFIVIFVRRADPRWYIQWGAFVIQNYTACIWVCRLYSRYTDYSALIQSRCRAHVGNTYFMYLLNGQPEIQYVYLLETPSRNPPLRGAPAGAQGATGFFFDNMRSKTQFCNTNFDF